jgi:hypothetical protein
MKIVVHRFSLCFGGKKSLRATTLLFAHKHVTCAPGDERDAQDTSQGESRREHDTPDNRRELLKPDTPRSREGHRQGERWRWAALGRPDCP